MRARLFLFAVFVSACRVAVRSGKEQMVRRVEAGQFEPENELAILGEFP